KPACHSFGKHVRESFAEARTGHHEIRGREQTRHVVATAEPKDVMRRSQIFRAGTEQHRGQVGQLRHRSEETAMLLHRSDPRDGTKPDCRRGKAARAPPGAPRASARPNLVDVEAVDAAPRSPGAIAQRKMRFETSNRVGRHKIWPSR